MTPWRQNGTVRQTDVHLPDYSRIFTEWKTRALYRLFSQSRHQSNVRTQVFLACYQAPEYMEAHRLTSITKITRRVRTPTRSMHTQDQTHEMTTISENREGHLSRTGITRSPSVPIFVLFLYS